MAFAISAPSIDTTTSARARAATWTSISAAISLVATVPLVWILTKPISQLTFVRGTDHDGNWGHVFGIALILTAPATYALFFGTAGELLKNRVSAKVHKSTMRVAAIGMLPYLTMATAAVYWDGGPQHPLLLTAGLSIPIAMAATICASTRLPSRGSRGAGE